MTDKTIKTYTDEWKNEPWKDLQINLFRLQHRIYKAAKDNDVKRIHKLQTYLVESKSARYLAVRQVSKLNTGKRNAGVDGLSKLNCKQRIQLAADLSQLKDWKHNKLRRVFMKENGTKRPLGIPTIRDRAMQCLIKYALEPVYESSVSDGDLGFRPHSTWDVQKCLFHNLKSSSNGYQKTIVPIDITKCFDNINHDKLMSLVVLPNRYKNALRSALKAGVLNERDKTLTGTPQGGVISPLLTNIALHGVEDLQNERYSNSRSLQRGFRYADHMVFILKKNESPDKLLLKINEFLKERGLNINQTKSKVVSATEGFDFLGWHFLVKSSNNKFVSFPSKKNHNNMKKKVKEIMKDTRYPLENRLKMVKTIYRGWFNYHQYCDMSQVNLWSLHNWVYKYLRKSSKMDLRDITATVREIFTGHTQKANWFTQRK